MKPVVMCSDTVLLTPRFSVPLWTPFIDLSRIMVDIVFLQECLGDAVVVLFIVVRLQISHFVGGECGLQSAHQFGSSFCFATRTS